MPHLPTPPSRRTMLKVGANAAWAVPAIQIATGTPAFAAGANSIVHSKLAVSIKSINQSGKSSNVDVTVSFSASVADAKNVTLTLSGGDAQSNVLKENVSYAVPGIVTAGATMPDQTFAKAQLKDGKTGGTLTVTIAGDTDQTATTDVVEAERASDAKTF